MLPPSVCLLAAQSSATVSAATSRASSRSNTGCHPGLIIFPPRTSSVEEAPGEDSADPDWDEEADDGKDEAGDDDPEYDPDARQRPKPVK